MNPSLDPQGASSPSFLSTLTAQLARERETANLPKIIRYGDNVEHKPLDDTQLLP